MNQSIINRISFLIAVVFLIQTSLLYADDGCELNLHSDEQLSYFIQARVDEEIHNADQWLKQKAFQFYQKRVKKNVFKYCKSKNICRAEEVTQIVQKSLEETTPEIFKRVPAKADKFVKAVIGNTYIVSAALASLMAGYGLSNIHGIPKYVPYILTPVTWTLFVAITAPFQDYLSSKFRMIGYRVREGKSLIRKDDQLKVLDDIYKGMQTKFTINQTTARGSVNNVVAGMRVVMKDSYDIIMNRFDDSKQLQRAADRLAEYIMFIQKNYPEVPYNNEDVLTAVKLIFTKHIDIDTKKKLKPMILDSIKEVSHKPDSAYLQHCEKIIDKWFEI